MSARPHPKYSSNDPHRGPWTTCDVCGFIWSQQSMAFQYDFLGGSVPQNTRFLKCPKCLDELNFQRKLIVIPPDPPPFMNTRPEPYDVDETDWLSDTSGDIIVGTPGDDPIIAQIPNPANVAETSELTASLKFHLGSVATAYIDLFLGNPASGGISVLANITGSATRFNASGQMTVVNGVASNYQGALVITGAATGGVAQAQQSVNFVGIYSAATGGNLLCSGGVGSSPTIAKGFVVQFSALGLFINLN